MPLTAADFTATEPGRADREASVGREVTSKAAAVAASRTPVASPNKTGTAAPPAAAELVGSQPGGGRAGGIQMQELKKEI